jgi:hypothetical protein
VEVFGALFTTAIIAIAVVAIVFQFVSTTGGPTVSGQITGSATSIVGDLFK